MTVLLNIVDNAVNEVEFLRLIRSTAVTIIYSVEYHNNYDSYTISRTLEIAYPYHATV